MLQGKGHVDFHGFFNWWERGPPSALLAAIRDAGFELQVGLECHEIIKNVGKLWVMHGF